MYEIYFILLRIPPVVILSEKRKNAESFERIDRPRSVDPAWSLLTVTLNSLEKETIRVDSIESTGIDNIFKPP